MDVEVIAAAIAAFVSLAVSAISYWQFKRKMRLDVIIKRRQESVEERRQALKELYYYTDSNLIKSLTDDAGKGHILKLLEIKSRFDYRLIDAFYPGSDLQESVDRLVDSTVRMVEKKMEWHVTDDLASVKEENYDKNRSECLRKVKLYNYASWEFLQSQSFGQPRNGVMSFYKSYKKTLKSINKVKNRKKYNGILEMTDGIISPSRAKLKRRANLKSRIGRMLKPFRNLLKR